MRRVCVISIWTGLMILSSIAFAQGPTGLSYKSEGNEDSRLGYQRFLLYLPERYHENTHTKWPLIIYLHGYYDINNYESLMDGSLPGLLETRKDLPFVVACPHMLTTESWNPDKIMNFTKRIIRNYRIDKNSIYLTGISWGGDGTWNTACAYPEFFAAIAPVCGPGNWYAAAETARKLRSLPIWVFHGEKDYYYSATSVVKMVDGLRSNGATVVFTLYPDLGHECWNQTYSNENLFKWFLDQNNEKRRRN